VHSYHVTRTTNKTNRNYYLLERAHARKHKILLFFVVKISKKGRKSLKTQKKIKKNSSSLRRRKVTLHCSSNVASTLWSFCSAFVALSSLRSPLRDRKRKSERTRARERSEKENEFGYIIHFSRRRRRRREEEEQVKKEEVKKSRRKTRSFER
jgi:hypothetical protein